MKSSGQLTPDPSEHGAFLVWTECRSCGAADLVDILSLGSHHVSNFVEGPEVQDTQPVPLELVLCRPDTGGCGLLQLRHSTSADLLYTHYWYRSVTNMTMRVALRDIVESAESIVPLKEGDLVLDVGCNDGTLLRSYSHPGLVRAGFEPAKNLVEHARVGTSTIVNSFFNADDFRTHFGSSRVRILTTIAMFYDLDDPNQFVRDVKSCLAEDGVWVIQMAYLPSMLEENMFDNICHEHLEYYSLMSLSKLLERHDMEIFDVLLNDVNGGSIRAYIRHRGNAVGQGDFGMARVNALRRFEADLRLESDAVYTEFARRVQEISSTLKAFISGVVGRGESVYVYGASTKGNTLLQFCGLDHTLITAAAERNPDKWGKRTVATSIPIISEDEARAAKPDYFLILPWHFLREFRDREAEFLAAGGQFIVPLPIPRLVDANGTKPLINPKT